ncbi:MAG: hypothetical protein ACRCWQ_01745 [Bacilli bacterium]
MHYALFFEHPEECSLALHCADSLNLPCFQTDENYLVVTSQHFHATCDLVRELGLTVELLVALQTSALRREEHFDDYVFHTGTFYTYFTQCFLLNSTCENETEYHMFTLHLEEYLIAKIEGMLLLPAHIAPLVSKYADIHTVNVTIPINL